MPGKSVGQLPRQRLVKQMKARGQVAKTLHFGKKLRPFLRRRRRAFHGGKVQHVAILIADLRPREFADLDHQEEKQAKPGQQRHCRHASAPGLPGCCRFYSWHREILPEFRYPMALPKKRCLELSGAHKSSIYCGWRVPDTFFWAKPYPITRR